MEQIHGADCLGKKLLILGDVNTGKTTLCRSILEELCRLGLGRQIAIVDLAPHIPEKLSFEKGLAGVGGSLTPPAGCGVIYLADRLEAPRLSSSSEAEAMEKARANRQIIEELFCRVDLERREILFVNDATLYLQAGTAEDLIARLGLAETLVVNGYRGESLGSGKLTLRERAETEKIRVWFERVGTVQTLDR
jgi:hypothetical protein